MKNKKQTILLILLCMVISFALVGCGAAVFGEEDALEEASAAVVISSGLTEIDELDAIISGGSSDSKKKSAKKRRAKVQSDMASAYLETHNVSTVDIILDIGDLAPGGRNTQDDNLFEALDLGEAISTSSLVESLDMYNSVSVNALPEEDQDSFELRKGIANTMMVVEIVESIYDIEGESFVDDGTSSKDNLNKLINPNGLSSLTEYAGNAVSGFENSGSFEGDDLDAISDLNAIAVELETLNGAVQAGDDDVFIDGNTYTLSGGSDEIDREIGRALEDIFGGGE